jgi:hypothetical protein
VSALGQLLAERNRLCGIPSEGERGVAEHKVKIDVGGPKSNKPCLSLIALPSISNYIATEP